MAELAAARGRAAGGGRCRARDARRQSLSGGRQTAGLQTAAGRRAGIGRDDLPRRRQDRHSPDPTALIRLVGLAGRRRGRNRRPPARRHPRRRGTPRRDLELAARRGGDPPHDRHRAGEIWRPGREARRQPGQGPRETRCGEGCRPRRRRCRKTGGRQESQGRNGARDRPGRRGRHRLLDRPSRRADAHPGPGLDLCRRLLARLRRRARSHHAGHHSGRDPRHGPEDLAAAAERRLALRDGASRPAARKHRMGRRRRHRLP